MLLFVTPCLAMASDYKVFQKDIMEPYGFYKKSLALTSKKKNREKAIDMVEKFIGSWEAFAQKYENDVPDQLKQTYDFNKKINRPVAVGHEALEMLRAGKVKIAHTQLEEVRYSLWQIRVDAGIVSLNDKINDFHEAMEVVLDGVAESHSSDSLQHLDARYGAWLAIKWAEIKSADYSGADKDAFSLAIANGHNAIAELRKNLKKGDAVGAKKAGGKVKKSYKTIFFLPECS
jgi:hypothetical protein